MHLDLHIHTTCSDGQVSPEQVVMQARRAGLHAIAITDHDTTSGVTRAQEEGVRQGVRVIAGTELSVNRDGAEMHLLAYGIDPSHPSIAAITASLGRLRRQRVGAMVDRLTSLGVTISIADVATPEGNASIGRPHVAEALVKVGAVRHVQEAFSRFLADGGPAYVPSRGPDVAEAIAAIHEAGGLSVWAHPAIEDTSRFGRLRRLGLDGVEVLRPGLAPVTSSALEHAARDAGLVVSGGSDFHGGSPPLGSWYVTHRHVGALLARLGMNET